jgi:diguanylate cyclase (GGDEF)-like protein/PAS domain S-box-containing protein
LVQSTAESAEYEALLQFLYMAPIGLVQAGVDGEILLANPLSAQLLIPVSRDGELANLFDVLERLAPDLRHRVASFDATHGTVLDAVQLQVDGGEHGARRPQVLSLSLLKLDNKRLMAVVNDVTASVARDRELRESQAWIDSIINGVAEYALMSLDAGGHVRTWNAGVDRLTGFDEQGTVGHSYSMFYPAGGISAQQTLDRLREADSSGWSLDEGWRRRHDGSLFWGSSLIAPLNRRFRLPLTGGEPDSPADAPAYSLIIRDISSDRDAREALRHAVYCDHLTGLANRRAFFEAAQLEVQRNLHVKRSLSLVMIDADHFKRVNDEYGHGVGDAVLRHLAAGLEATFRARDVKARIGGEEFVVLLPGTGVEEALELATRFCESTARAAAEIDGIQVRYTVSAGVASMDAAAGTIDALLKRADAALYRAKANGRNRVECWSADTVLTAEQLA